MTARWYQINLLFLYLIIAFLLIAGWHARTEVGRACGVGTGSIANGKFATLNKDTYVCSNGELIRVTIVPIPHPPIEM
jgi:hypothetical protein